MVNLTNIILIVLIGILSPLVQAAPSQPDSKIEQIIPKVEKKIASLMKEQGVPGMAVAIVSKDKVYYLNTFGVKRLGRKDKITPNTLFQIASLSKPINATMLAILQEKGKLSLEDPVHDYIPGFQRRNTKHTLKICHLASHSTGIATGGFNELIEAYAPREKIVSKLQKSAIVSTPGKQFAYHNAMYGMIEDVIACASGKSFERTIREDLFIPLGMRNASVGFEALLHSSDKAYPHVKAYRGKYIPAEHYSKAYYAFLAAGGINASVKDLVPFLQLYLGKPSSIISKQTLRQLTSPYVKNPRAVIVGEAKKGKITNTYYGFGWHSMNYAQKKVIYHQGHLKGFRNFIGFIQDDIGIIVLTNADKRHASKVALAFFDLYLSS